MQYIFCALLGYLLGSVNPAYLFSKRKGVDIRTKGSGNAGASNALILFGKTFGVICALLDIGKTYLALLLADILFPECTHAFVVTGIFCILGHIFPFYMKFRGGKGLACLGGMILYFNRYLFFVLLALELVLVLITDYICIVPVTASLLFPVMYAVMTRDFRAASLLITVPCVMITKHLENFDRIRNGTEMRFSYLWHPQEEIERLRENRSDDE